MKRDRTSAGRSRVGVADCAPGSVPRINGLPEEIKHHYTAEIAEDLRIRHGAGRLELDRVQEIVRRHLPARPVKILDVGGASGVHTEWLLDDGHQVHLVDPLPMHVEQAHARLGGQTGFTAEVGDARALPAGDGMYDAVLLFGPLYHLTSRHHRVLAWREASRTVGPDGLVFGMGISRFASLIDGLARSFIFDSEFRSIVAEDLASGQHRNPTGRPEWFTTAYFHRPEELAEEAESAGLVVEALVAVEGLAAWLPGVAERWPDQADRKVILDAVRSVESEGSLLGASPHVITVGRVGPPTSGG